VRRSYERQVGESPVAFRAFALYRDLGPERSLKQVWQKQGKSRAVIEKWSASHRWVERAESWDDECDRAVRRKNLAVMEQMAERYARAAYAASNALMLPIMTLLKHLEKNPRYLDGVEPEELCRLAIRAARALRVVHLAEAEARTALPLPEPEGDDGYEFELADWEPPTGKRQ
jgi:hypothetical protein